MSDAITRNESLLKSIADGTSSSLKPITREEQYLAYIAGETNSFPLEPITREEAFLDKIAKNGAGGGGSSINVQPLTVTENGTFDAPEGQAYDPVIVNVASGGGAELNIAYGDTAPEDTSKLWIKTSKPSKVKVSKELQKVFEEGASTVTTADGSASMNYGAWAPMGNRIYGFGGNQGNKGYTTEIFYYDTLDEQGVTIGATLPVNVCFASACACGSKIYLFGGRGGAAGACLNTIYCLDTQTDTLTTLSATLSQTLRATASAAYGTKIYIFGGSNGDKRINAIHCFDCETETISTLSTVLPVASSNFAVSNYKDYIYIFGGYNSERSIWKFDCITETIEIVNTSLPVNLSDGCATTMAKSIFVFGYSNRIMCFDIEAETIKTLSATMPNTLNYPSALATEDDKIYIVSDKSPYCFSLDMKVVLDNGTLQIQSAFAVNLFNLINTDTAQVEIGVNAVYKGNADGIAEVVEASLHNGTTWVTI